MLMAVPQVSQRMNGVVLCVSAVFFSMVLALTPTRATAAKARPGACEALFQKEKILNPSLEITPEGQIVVKLASSESVVGRLNPLTRSLYKPLAIDKIEDVMKRLTADARDLPFWEKFSDAFGLQIQIDPKALEWIPRTGGLPVVMNHNANGVEGLAVAAIISKVRSDVKVVLTPLLSVIPNLDKNAIFIRPNLSKAAKEFNLPNLQSAADHVKNGGALVICPTGEIAAKQKFFDKEVVEGRWRKGVAYILQQAPDAQVLPIFAEGQPSSTYSNVWFFTKKIPLKHEKWQTAINAPFHVREIGNRVATTMKFVIGKPISATEINSWKDPSRRANGATVMNNLRQRTLDLRHENAERVPLRSLPETIALQRDMRPVLAELGKNASVVYDMDPESPNKKMKVFLAKGRDIPETMKEIGRLREITFRSVGEGSGRSRDLDDYDPLYDHFIPVEKKSIDETKADGLEIAGSYRAGRVDEIIDARGETGLYSSKFFDLSKLLVGGYLRDGIELGRSFVQPKFQRRSFTLLALFNSIGRMVVANPRYKYLAGCVSISNEVTERSRGLIIAYLKMFHESPNAHLVAARTPLKKDLELSAEDLDFLEQAKQIEDSVTRMATLTKRVNAIEEAAGSGNTMPALIPIYVALGAEFFKFNVDSDFNTLDGFIVVDLSKLNVGILTPYMGEEGARRFLAYHQLRDR